MSNMPPEFDSPTGSENTESDEIASVANFQAPPEKLDVGSQAAFMPDAYGLGTGVPSRTLDAHEQLASAIQSQNRTSAAQTFTLGSDEQILNNVEAVAIGIGDPSTGVPGEPVLTVFVDHRSGVENMRSVIVDGLGVESAKDVPMAVRVSGEFDTFAQTHRLRAAPAGISVGHTKVTAGTFGALSIGKSAPRNNRLLVLSNNHVLANSNNAVYGDSIIQPGTYDGGKHPDDQIAILERFVPVQAGGAKNYVDAATAWAWPDRVRREQAYRSGTGYSLFRAGNTPEYPSLNDLVGKAGRTTELTQGRVVALNWSGWINGYSGGAAFFTGQFVIQSASGNFSAGGDSGSLIWKWKTGLPPTGLLFAGGGGYTIANPLPWVTQLLDINLYT